MTTVSKCENLFELSITGYVDGSNGGEENEELHAELMEDDIPKLHTLAYVEEMFK